jgi:galactokinase
MALPPIPASLLPFAALLKGAAEDFLQLDAPLYLSRAPGSVDILGGPSEMPGMLSVGQALGRSVFCAIQNRKDDRIRIRVLRGQSEGGHQEWSGRISLLYTKKGPPRSLVILQQSFQADGAPWMMEFVAAMIGLRRTHQLNTPKQGFDLVLWDQIPATSGAGRTAARATALALAFKASTGLDKKRVDGVRVARAVAYGQHEVLGRALGLTPALVSGVARSGCLLQIEHAAVTEAKSGDAVGIKISQKSHPNDKVFKVIS